MKYQYIYGRTNTGYKVIKSNDNSKYSNDFKVEKALHLQIFNPENCENNLLPEPIIFINNIADKKNAVIGKYKILDDERDNIICHFFIFDGVDVKKLNENFDSFFDTNNFITGVEDAKQFDINKNIKFNNIITEKAVDILKYFGITKDVFRTLLVALFDSSSTNKEIYFVNKNSDKTTVLHNIDLTLLLYSFLPKYIIQNLGFITYFKYIAPSNQDTLNANIKLRFVENNAENNNQYLEQQMKGNYIFDLTNNYFTANKDIIDENLFLDFLCDTLEKDGTKDEILDFYNYINTVLENFEDAPFELVSSLYSFWSYKNENKIIESKDLESLLKYYNLFKDVFKNEYNSYIIKNYKNLREIFKTAESYNRFLLDIYNNIDELRETIVEDFAVQISNDALLESYVTLDALGYNNASQLFINSLRKTLLSEKAYTNGGIFLIEKSLCELSKKENKQEMIINIVSLFEQFANISGNIFEDVNVDHYIKDFIIEPLKISTLETFEKYIKKLNEIINKINNKDGKSNLEEIYIITSILYLKLNMAKLKNANEQKIVDSFFEILNVVSENKIILTYSAFVNYFNEFFTEIFKNSFSAKKLDKLIYFLDTVNMFSGNYSQAKFLIINSNQILKSTLANVEVLDKNAVEEMSSWKDIYINQTENNYIIQTIYEYKKTEEMKMILNENDFLKIQEFFINRVNEKYSKTLHDNVMKETVEWLNREKKHFKNKFDYKILFFIFKYDLIKSIEYLPDDNIDIWVEYLQFIIDNDDTSFILHDSIERAVKSTKQLYTQYKKLPANKKNILFTESMRTEYNKKSLFDFEKFQILFYIAFALTIYLINIIINSSFDIENVYLTTGINIFSGGIFLTFILISIFEKAKLINITILLIAIVATSINFMAIIQQSTNTNTQNLVLYKKIYKIKYDFDAPIITIVSEHIKDMNTNTLTEVKGNKVDIQNDKHFLLEYNILDKDSRVAEKTITLKDGDKIIDDFSSQDNNIVVNMSKYSLGLKKLEIISKDIFNNESTETIVLNNIEPPVLEKIELSIETNKTIINSESATKNEFTTDSTLTLRKNENLNIKVSANSKKPIEIWFKINEKEETLELVDGKYVGDFTEKNFLDGENDLTVTVKSTDDKKTINLKLNLIANDGL